jgi:vancomycin permeability regulator SanA
MKRAIRLIVISSVVAIAYFAITVVQVWRVGTNDQSRPVDAIVVMGVAQYDGRPSPQLQARLDHVLTLWRDGVADIVVTTGGNQPGDRFTEAEASANYLQEAGVPESAILQETVGSSTYESIEGVFALLSVRDMDRIMIVTDAYHASRSRMIAQDFSLETYVSATPSSVISGSENARLHAKEAAGIALAQVIGFRALDRLSR